MAEAYAVVLRERVVRAYEAGDGSYPVIAARFALGEATVKRWVWRYRRDGQLGPAKKGGGTPSRITALLHESSMAARGQSTGSSPADAIRHWSGEGGHPIQDLTAENGLTPLPSWTPGAKAIADDGLVAEERVLHPALTMVP